LPDFAEDLRHVREVFFCVRIAREELPACARCLSVGSRPFARDDIGVRTKKNYQNLA